MLACERLLTDSAAYTHLPRPTPLNPHGSHSEHREMAFPTDIL